MTGITLLAFTLAVEVFDPNTAFGAVGPIVLVLGIVVSAIAYAKTKTNEAWKLSSEGWKAEAEAARQRGDRLQEALNAERDLAHHYVERIAGLEARTDLRPLQEGQEQIVAALGHQARLLERIADRFDVNEDRASGRPSS